jgi:hypothetical protein
MAKLPLFRDCGTHDVHIAMLQSNPDYARARLSIEAQARNFLTSARAAEREMRRVIPVVVHVIYRSETENISDGQIASQIDALNRDFRMRNADLVNVPAPFKPLAADAQIEFVLARIDPAGQPTSGITRTKTAVPRFSTDNTMKFSVQGGHDAWDGSRYLNLWVCPEIFRGTTNQPLLGYAQFPGGLPATDGVAIVHQAFGTVGTSVVPFDLGRTATHEVAHWLDLFHIWGDMDDCTGDDHVDDTPRQQTANTNTPSFPHITCNNGPNGDMFMNYMDYVNDRAMFMFTVGQVARMQATLANARATIGLPHIAALAGVSALPG